MTPPTTRLAGSEGGPVAFAILIGSPAITAATGPLPWWGSGLLVGSAVLAVWLQVRGRTPVRWLLDALAFYLGRAARARQRLASPHLQDVTVSSGSCAVGVSDSSLFAMIQLAPNLDLPSVIGEESIYTEDTIDAVMLTRLCEQYGLTFDIDIVSTGRRVRKVGSYGELYDQLIGPRPIVGQRLAWLVVRLDQGSNLRELQRRGSCSVAGPQALATAAQRIAARLRQAGIAAHPLPADAVLEAVRVLQEGVELDSLRERWGRLDCAATGRAVRMYEVDSQDVGDIDLDHYWAHGTSYTTIVVSLRHNQRSRILVRYIGTWDKNQRDTTPSHLRLLTGQQSTALLATLPTPTVAHTLPTRAAHTEPAEADASLKVTIGPNGQVLGSINGHKNHTLALPLFDPVHYQPRRRTVDVHADLPIAQQIVLRATVVGADVEVHTDRPDSWERLVSAVGDHRSLRLANSGHTDGTAQSLHAPPATIVVFDQVSPSVSQAPTTLTITAPDQPRHRDVDLAIEQIGEAAVEVSIPLRTVRIDLIEPRGETRYVDTRPPLPPLLDRQPAHSDHSTVESAAAHTPVNSGDAR